MNVPILGQQPKTTAFICKAGHTIESTTVFRLHLFASALNGMPVPAFYSGPACPICIADHLAFTFPQWPEGMTMEMAVEQGILNKACLPQELNDA